MTSLQQLALTNPHWSLEDFVQAVNDWLPQFLPLAEKSRIQDEVNPRLVRYYTTQGLLDKPLRAGREARYTYRHLLQLLVVRRLLMEGYSSPAIEKLVISKANSDLEALLQGGVQLSVEAANPALAFLQQVQQRSAVPPAPMALSASPPVPEAALASEPSPARWTRLEILPGLELHLREDFVYPNSVQEQQNLLQLIGQRLAHYLSTLSPRKRL